MKAVQINSYGGSEVLELKNISQPHASKGQVLVEVHAASINPFDWKIRAGYLKEMMPLHFPATLGGDFAGVVVKISEDVSDFKVGDEVYGSAIVLNGGSGTFAEFAAANTGNTAHKPKTVNFEQAAALPLVGASAIQALEVYIKLQKGQKILIHGGAGGIGGVAIQLAKSIGAYVVTTVSQDDKEYVRKLGADEVIDYKNEKFEEKLKDLDAVFDNVGGETTDRSFLVLKKGGVIVSMLGQPNPQLAQQHGVIGIGQGTEINTKSLKRLAELVDRGKIKAQVDKVFPLDRVREAFEYQEKDSPRGKVVLKVKS